MPSTVPPLRNEQDEHREHRPGKKKSRFGKRIFILLVIVLGVYALWSAWSVFMTPDHNVRQIYLIPRDAAVIIQTDDPVGDWKRFSASPPWQTLKQAPSFAQIARNVNSLDSLLKANRGMLSLVGKREMMISLHKTRTAGWDFLAVVDLQKVSKVNSVKDNIEQIFKVSGYTVTNRRYKGIDITESQDRKTHEILYTAFVDNHFLASYNTRLVEKAIDEREDPLIGLQDAFIEVERSAAGKGLCRVYLNFAYLPQYLSIYLGRDPYVDMLCNSMGYGGLNLVSDKEKMELTGNVTLLAEPDAYVGALLNSGTHKMAAHEIMSARTAFYVNLGFENTGKFVTELEKALSVHDKKSYDSYKSARAKLEKYFGISMQENFLGWMDGEFALSQSEPGLLGTDPEQILAIRAKSIREARKNMDLIEKRVTRRSPVSVRTIEYKDFEIKYIEMSGFFRLFFGNLFDKFEKPYYTYVGDYVVFSNTPNSLLSFIEDYRQGNLMRENEGFQRSYMQVAHTSTIFAYVNMPKFFPQLRYLLTAQAWSDLQSSREVLYSFPQWTLQVVGGKGSVSLQYVINYKPYVSDTVTVSEDEEVAEAAGEDLSERELMSELKRFYVENFEGNVLREYYPDGQLQSESEVRHGRRDGRYREFYPDGKLRVRGNYSDNKPRGMWKYYTEEGKFDRKERH